jgi:hypothetical protein
MEVNRATSMTQKYNRNKVFGNFQCTLKPGNIQKMMFQPGDEGPFYLTPEQQEERREGKQAEG